MTNKRLFFTVGTAAVLIMGSAGMLVGHASSTQPNALCAQQTSSSAQDNCKLVTEFYDAFFNRYELKAADTAVASDYIQHNPGLSNGRQALVDSFGGYFREHPHTHSEILRVSASGDLVWLHVHDTSGPDDRGTAVVDIFRVKGGRIVEHWDVLQEVPAKAANTNSMF